MSRRTKFIITALFLVLLSVPVVYVFWSWRPENPLRFRVVAQTLPSVGDGPFRERILLVEIRNTSTVPVYLSDAKLVAFNPSRGRRHVFVELEKFVLGPGSTSAYDPFKPRLAPIPPGEIQRTEVRVPDDAAGQFHHTDPTIDYVYLSETKHRAFDLSQWLKEKVPLQFAGHVPTPRTDIATIPLEYPLPSP